MGPVSGLDRGTLRDDDAMGCATEVGTVEGIGTPGVVGGKNAVNGVMAGIGLRELEGCCVAIGGWVDGLK